MLTVLLPTAARPGMLRTALRSVAAQTAVQRIGRVVVSENGASRESALVCAEFPQLPIEYVLRSPVLTPLEHGRALMERSSAGEFTAVLHDDDWWTPHHLAAALDALEANPDSAAYGAGHFVVAGESSMLNCSGNLFAWFGASYPDFAPWWKLSRLNVLLAEMLGTISHYSTLVARTDALRRSTHIFDLGNPFDNDRMLMFALSTCGPLLFNPLPGAFVRNHGVQDCYHFDDRKRREHMRATTRWMVEASGRPWRAISDHFARRLAQCPPSAVATLKALAGQEWCVPELKRHAPELAAVCATPGKAPAFSAAGT